MKGLPVRMRLRDQLPAGAKIRESTEIPEDEIEVALDELLDQLEAIHYAFHLNEQVPARLIYEDFLKMLEEVHEVMGVPGWVTGFCKNFCPDCIHRPWCDVGCSFCWDEDRAAGHILFTDALSRYVSPSPVSLEILESRYEGDDDEWDGEWDEGELLF